MQAVTGFLACDLIHSTSQQAAAAARAELVVGDAPFF
jgi:hypothetical protein